MTVLLDNWANDAWDNYKEFPEYVIRYGLFREDLCNIMLRYKWLL